MNSDKNPELIKRMIENAQRQHEQESFLHTTSGTRANSARFQGDRKFVHSYRDSEISNFRGPRPESTSAEPGKSIRPEAPARPERFARPKNPTSKVGSGFAPSQRRPGI